MVSIDLDSMVNEFTSSRNPQLFEADKQKLIEKNDWRVDSGVNVQAIRSTLSQYSALHKSGELRIPLHEMDSPELTGEYIIYKKTQFGPTYGYYDTGRNKRNRISVSNVGQTLCGWRLRFWHPNFEPDSEPSFQTLSEEEEQLLDTLPEYISPSPCSKSRADDLYDHLHEFVSQQKGEKKQTNLEDYRVLSQWEYKRSHGGVHEVVPVVSTSSNSGAEQWYVQIPEDSDVLDDDEFVSVATDIWIDNDVLIDSPPGDGTPDTFPVEGTVSEVDSKGFSFTLQNRTDQAAKVELRRRFTGEDALLAIYPLFNPVPHDRELNGIRTVRDSSSERTAITGNDDLEFTPERALRSEFPELNESQRLAAKQAIAADEVALIHGPPGTGKTRTLIALIRYFAQRDMDVLACAHSNQAADNLLVGGSTQEDPEEGSLHEVALNGNLEITRIGSGSENPVVRQHYTSTARSKADVIGATMSSTADLNRNQFDVVVVDEASQATMPATFLPYLAAEKMILAGDHKQLPPYGSQELREREMEVSLYEHFVERYGQDLPVMLTTQYRMHEQIAEFPSEQFYDGAVVTAERDSDYTMFGFSLVVAHQVAGDEEKVHGRTYSNKREAEVVAQHGHKLREAGVPESEIGIITGYTGQIQTISQELDGLDTRTADIVVDTVDSFQGGERAAIIMSFCRSNESGNSGFLSLPDEGPRRLNVALTRAKYRLVLIGNWDTLCAEEPSDRADCSQLYRSFKSWLINQGCFESVPTSVAD